MRENTWAMLAHLSSLAALLGIPFANILGPLAVWVLRKDRMPFVDDQGKESINFQLSMTAYAAVVWVLCFALVGFLLLVPLALAWLGFVIRASVCAHRGRTYRYPLIFRPLK